MMANKFKRFIRMPSLIFAVLAALLIPGLSHAYSAVAWLDGQVRINFAATNYASQKDADVAALEGCRTRARENGKSGDAAKCKIANRQKVAGGGAVVCGKSGCTIATGFDTEQLAIDRAYRMCEEANYGDCQKTGMTGWLDEEGYPKPAAKKIAAAAHCGPTPGKPVRSSSQCTNGDCTRTFENGCTVRFQAPYCHNPISGQWEWKPDGC